MAERADSTVILALDAIVKALETLKGQSGSSYLTDVRTVKAFDGPDDLRLPRPSVLVKVAGWGPDLPLNAPHHNTPVTFQVACLLNEAQAWRKAWNLAADVMRVLQTDVTIDETIKGGLFAEAKEVEAEGDVGEAMVVVTLKGIVFWTTTAP